MAADDGVSEQITGQEGHAQCAAALRGVVRPHPLKVVPSSRLSSGMRSKNARDGEGSPGISPPGSPEEVPNFKVGDRVQAFNGKGLIYLATVAEVHNGGSEYTVDWDDCDPEHRRLPASDVLEPLPGKSSPSSVDRARMAKREAEAAALAVDGADVPAKSAEPAATLDTAVTLPVMVNEISAKFSVGSTVEADWGARGTYYMGTVIAVNSDGSYKLQYVDGDTEDAVLETNMRAVRGRRHAAVGPAPAITAPPVANVKASKSGRQQVKLAASSDAGERVSKASFNVGDSVEANCRQRGTYYMAVVTAANTDGSYRLDYVDGDTEDGVLVQHMRAAQSRRRAPARAPSLPAQTTSSQQAPAKRQQLRKTSSSEPCQPKSKKHKKQDVSVKSSQPVVEVDESVIPLDTRLQVWQGSGPALSIETMNQRRNSMEFHDVFAAALSPQRQNESLNRRSLTVPNVVSETPSYYRQQEHFQVQDKYLKDKRSAAQIESEVDYELDHHDDQWLSSLNNELAQAAHKAKLAAVYNVGDTVEANCRQRGTYYMAVVTAANTDGSYRLDYVDGDTEDGVLVQHMRAVQGRRKDGPDLDVLPLTAQDLEVIIDRFEKADAKLHKMQGHSAARTEVLLTNCETVAGLPTIAHKVLTRVHGWWKQKRQQAGHQLLRRFRAAPDRDDPDENKIFRKVSPFRKGPEPVSTATGRKGQSQYEVGDIVEANWHGRGNYYGGLIAAVNPNGSFAIKYDDGDCEDNVPAKSIRNLGRRRARVVPSANGRSAKRPAKTSAGASSRRKQPAKRGNANKRVATQQVSNKRKSTVARKTDNARARKSGTLKAKLKNRNVLKKSVGHKRKSADDANISAAGVTKLREGDRVQFQWEEPEGEDDGKWFLATLGKCHGQCWFEVDFDEFEVNAQSWNLKRKAVDGGLRYCIDDAGHSVSDQAEEDKACSALESESECANSESESVAESPSQSECEQSDTESAAESGYDSADALDHSQSIVSRPPVDADAERKLLGKWRKSAPSVARRVSVGQPIADDATWKYLWGRLEQAGWTMETFADDRVLYFTPQRKSFVDSRQDVIKVLVDKFVAS